MTDMANFRFRQNISHIPVAGFFFFFNELSKKKIAFAPASGQLKLIYNQIWQTYVYTHISMTAFWAFLTQQIICKVWNNPPWLALQIPITVIEFLACTVSQTLGELKLICGFSLKGQPAHKAASRMWTTSNPIPNTFWKHAWSCWIYCQEKPTARSKLTLWSEEVSLSLTPLPLPPSPHVYLFILAAGSSRKTAAVINYVRPCDGWIYLGGDFVTEAGEWTVEPPAASLLNCLHWTAIKLLLIKSIGSSDTISFCSNEIDAFECLLNSSAVLHSVMIELICIIYQALHVSPICTLNLMIAACRIFFFIFFFVLKCNF